MKIKNQKVTRQLQADIDQQNSQVVFSFATETPYLRSTQLGQYYQILKCQPQYVNTSRLDDDACQLLLDHNWQRTVGVCKKYWFANKKLYASCKFSKSQFAQGIKRDVLDLIRRNVSLGYIVKDYKVVDPIDGIKTIEVTNWEPYQFSIVSVPADINAGYLRSLDNSIEEKEQKGIQMDAQNNKDVSTELATETTIETKEADVDLEDKNLDGEDLEGTSEEATEVEKEKEKQLEQEDQQKEVCPECGKDPCQCEKSCDGEKPEEKECGEAPKQEEKQLEPTVEDLRAALEKQLESDAKEIRELGLIVKDSEAAEKFVAEHKSLNQFKTYLKNKNSEKSKNSIQDNTKMEKKYFSIVHAIRNAGNLNKNVDFSEDYETQVINENKRTLSIIDADIVLTNAQLYANNTRALGPSAGVGAELINTDYLPQEFVPYNRPQLTIDKVGSYSIPSDGNPVSFAQCTSGATADMYSIDGELADREMNFVLKTLTPHKAGVNIPIPYSLLLEGRPDIDAMVQADVVNALYQKRDEQVWIGTGADNQVAGIESLTGINIITGASIGGGDAWGAMLSAVGEIRKKNIFTENISYVMNTDTYTTLKKTMKDTNNCFAGFIIGDDDRIGKYPVFVNNAVSANTILVVCGEYIAVSDFQGIGILVDPYTLSKKQALKVTAWAAFDMVLRNLGAATKVVLDA